MKLKRMNSLLLCLVLLFSLYPQNVVASESTPLTVTSPTNYSTITTASPVYAGTTASNTEVAVWVDGTLMVYVPSDASGNWSVGQITPLPEGSHTVRAVPTDGMGAETGPAITVSFTVDTMSQTPVITNPVNETLTNSNTPVITGAAEASSTVTIYMDGVSQGTTTASGAGNWSFTQPTPLSEGSHNVKARATDTAGNTSQESSPISFTVDTAAPSAPVVISPSNGVLTKYKKPAISGTAESQSTVTIYVNNAALDTVFVTREDGAWVYSPSADLSDGVNSVKATATDAVGNLSPFSNINTFTVDSVPPPPPVITSPANSSITMNNTSTIAGTAEASSTVSVYVDGAFFHNVTANGSGDWSTQSSTLSEGGHSVVARASDAAMNVGSNSTIVTFTVDTTPPAAPVVITPANGSGTNDNTPTISGTAEPSSTVTVYADGSAQGTTTADVAGNWSYTQMSSLSDGSHTVKAKATDAAGNTGVFSNTNTFTIDTLPPPAPVVATPGYGSITNNNKPVITGAAESSSTVSVIIDGAPAGTTTADGSGNWSYTVENALADGSHSVRAFATDAYGNASGDSNNLYFQIDTTPPQAPVITSPASGSATSDTTPSFSGTAEAGSTIEVFINDIPAGTVTASQAGSFDFTPPTALADHVYSMIVVSTDTAGNSMNSTLFTFTVDTDLPSVPVITAPVSSSTTKDSTPVISGTAEALSTVFLVMDTVSVGSVTADAQGNWAFTPTSMLVDGTHAVKAKARDAAGNESLFSNDCQFTVDTTLPVTIASLVGLTFPVSGAVPVTHIQETSEYTGTVVWAPADAVFKPGTLYAATITLQLKPGYAVSSVPANFFTIAGAATTNTAGSGVILAVFPPTQPSMVWNVVFWNEGNVYANRTAIDGTSIGPANWPVNPTRHGYTFGGWYTEQNGRGSVFSSGSIVTRDTTVYAKWTAVAPSDSPDSPPPPSVLFNNAPSPLFSLVPDAGTPGLQVLIIGPGSLSALQQPGQQLSITAPLQQLGTAGPLPPPIAPFFPGGIAPGPAGTVYDQYVAFGFTDRLISSPSPGGTVNFQTNAGGITLPSNMLTGGGTQTGTGNAVLTILSGSLGGGLGGGLGGSGLGGGLSGGFGGGLGGGTGGGLSSGFGGLGGSGLGGGPNGGGTGGGLGGSPNGGLGVNPGNGQGGVLGGNQGNRPDNGQGIGQGDSPNSGQSNGQGSGPDSGPSGGGLQATYFGLLVGGVPFGPATPDRAPNQGGSGSAAGTVTPPAPIQISIPYSPAAGNGSGNPTVMHIGDDGSITPVSGSVYNPEMGTIDFSTNQLGCFVIVNQP